MIIIAKDQVREPLYCIVPVFNPWRWKSRWKHVDRAIKHFMDAGVVLVLVEAGFNRRELVYADSGIDGTPANCGVLGTDHNFRHRYIGLHTKDELWLKENLINVAVQQLPYNWQQVCWLDGDIIFSRPNWVGECIHQLQHYKFLQMFSQARDLDPDYQLLPENYPYANGVGFVAGWKEGLIRSDDDLSRESRNSKEEKESENILNKDLGVIQQDVDRLKIRVDRAGAQRLATDVDRFEEDFDYYGPPRVWPGLAWACTHQAWDEVGGLIDFAVWGGADHHMAHALIEKPSRMMRGDLDPSYQKLIMEWYNRCHTHIRRNLGVMQGAVFHNWHGPKTARGYNTRHGILARFGFDPLKHLKRDSQGLWQLHDDWSLEYIKLRDMLRQISLERNEDDIHTGLESVPQGH